MARGRHGALRVPASARVRLRSPVAARHDPFMPPPGRTAARTAREPSRPRFRLEDAPPELRDNPLVRHMAEIDPRTEAMLDECDALDRELGLPDVPDPDDE